MQNNLIQQDLRLIIIIKKLALLKIGDIVLKNSILDYTKLGGRHNYCIKFSANPIKFTRSYGVVDNLYDNFYDYTLQTSNGQPTGEQFTRLTRDGNTFAVNLANTAEGIYYIQSLCK